MPHHNPVVHFEILGRDQKVLEEFYTSVFNWKIDPVAEGYSIAKPGSGISGGIGAKGAAREHVTIYVAVEDVEAALALIESRGGQRAYGPLPTPDGGIFAGFLDPEGHLVGLVSGPK